MKWRSLIYLILILTAASCSEQDRESSVGDEWINSDTRVLFFDTLTVKSSTLRLDSVVVSGSRRTLIGQYDDPVFGKIRSKSYFQLVPSRYSIDSEAEFDSIAFILRYDKYTSGDTLFSQKYLISKVTEDLEPHDELYYNTSYYSSAADIIADHRFHPRPHSKDSTHISLDNEFGERLFKKLQTKEITDANKFLNEYPGILVEPEVPSTAILGFSKQSYIRIYYTNSGELVNEEETLDLLIISKNTFHNISAGLSTNLLPGLPPQNQSLPSWETGNQSFIQAGSGIATKIEIPHLKSLDDLEGTGNIVEAELKFTLNVSKNKTIRPVNDSLPLLIINQRNEIIGEVLGYHNQQTTARIIKEEYEFSTVEYSVPIKKFIDDKIYEYDGDNWSLLMYAPQINSSVDAYELFAEDAPKEQKMKIEITYAIYDE
ncbi:DUF4270 family protein [Christiangramia crocea]|uniref:DUF4270 domain-containing protein n=1 Tax=Christiangramia crocea TaxID=2904124 RepID=A0A9X2A6V5_9FLAO|nr:DUF4270 family protein [Gramella crocea]MCG9970892.1 DUF4270 domain-containing protein [Gramella crocea]